MFMMKSLASWVIILVGLLVGQVVAQRPRVTMPDGTIITGTNIPFNESQYIGVDEMTIEAFLGIPFAEPPIGDQRFKPPVKIGYLGSTYQAAFDRAICPQISPVSDLPLPGVVRNVDEDCLYLGVHRASSPLPSNAPVLVWFHGGGYTIGAGSSDIYEPLSLVALSPDIVFVTVNYRLGVYGFLTTGDDTAPGNYGMFDQVMALQWVQDNIAAFGGDPSKVTIMGESAGAGSVGLHLLSPLSTNLFHQAIMESGNALCPWAVDTNMDRQIAFTRELAAMVNCMETDNEALIECLRGVDEQNLTRAQITLTGENLVIELVFAPVVDNAFLPDIPQELVKEHNFNSVPTLIGTNHDEGTLLTLRAYPSYVVRQRPPDMTLEDFREMLPDYLYYSSPMVASAVEQWYIDWTKADNVSENHIESFINLHTDQAFACPAEAMARAMYETGAPVYRYEMTHIPTMSVFAGVPGWLGAGHAEELQFVFGWGLNQKLTPLLRRQSDEEKEMTVQFMRYWTNFIKTGNPNEPDSTSEYPDWPMYTLPEQEYKMLSLTMENGRAMRMDTCAFWLNYAPVLYNYGDEDDLYEDWKREYAEWKNVYMTEWNEAFEDYKDNKGCDEP